MDDLQAGSEGSMGREIVDRVRMRDLVDNLGDGLYDVIQSFIEDTPLMLSNMRAAQSQGDLDELSRLAHSLKSSSGIFGARQMIDLCGEIEMGANTGHRDLHGQIDALEKAYQEVHLVLNSYLPS